jgi:type IV secretory pathway VirB10-like protein
MDDTDPRQTRIERPAAGQENPIVGHTSAGASPWMIAVGLGATAIALFLFLDARRTRAAEPPGMTPADATAYQVAEAPPLDLAPSPAPPAAPPPTPLVEPQPILAAPPPASAPPEDDSRRRRAPTIVVDFGAPLDNPGAPTVDGSEGPVVDGANLPSSAAAPTGGANAADAISQSSPLVSAGGSAGSLGSYGRFAGSSADMLATPAAAVATRMDDPANIITQGAMIPAVLETAINSDLPGFARAVVARDVRGFDGRNVLIPRGSRVIGQYRSAIALGQSRVFVIWTRVIRPDGVSVQIGSPGADALGRGGLSGDVNRHFFSRFGGSILLSVLNAGIASINDTPSTQITIGSPAAAVGAAASVNPVQGDQIMPTIKVPQGEAINIFVARDLDFAAVNAP